MTEYRRILPDGAVVQVVRDGEMLRAADGRSVKADDAVHLPPVAPSKIIAVHLNYRSRVEERSPRRASPGRKLLDHGGDVLALAFRGSCGYDR